MFSVAAGRPRLFALRAAPLALRRGIAVSYPSRSVGGPVSADAEGTGGADDATGDHADVAAAPVTPEAAESPVLNKGAGAGQKTVAERTREYLARTAPKTPREAVDRKLEKHEWIRPRINPNVLLHGKDSVAPESVYEHPYRPFRLKDFASIQSILDVPDPILDTVVKHKIEPSVHIPKPGEIQWRNINPDTSGPVFRPNGRGISPNATDELEQKISEVTPLSIEEVRDLHRYTVTVKRVVHQSHKGRVASFFVLVVAGNGRGMVGYGQGKAAMPRDAFQMALVQAVKSMDFIERFEGRTIPMVWERKFGATKLIMRPRPAGTCCSASPHQ